MVDFQIAGKRILEVGCGIALASLVLNGRTADITATDYQPETETFLLENIRLNKDNPIPFFCTGWGDPIAGLGDFDLIIGSDLLYEQGHAELQASFGYASRKHQPSKTNDTYPPFKGSILCYVR